MNTKKKIMTVFGTRPEAIKMAPLIKALQKDERFSVYVCVLRQHKEVSRILSFFDINPDKELGIQLSDRGVFSKNPFKKVIAAVSTGINFLRFYKLLSSESPDIVLVHGDTSTAFLTSFIAFNKKLSVGHVEAGLRTYDKYAPFPEEINRQLIGRIADCHFAPTETAKNNLLQENINKDSIYVVGNTGLDAVRIMINQDIDKDHQFSKKFILVTAHRRESFGGGLERICTAIQTIAENHPDIDIVYPVHYNPNVRDVVFNKLDDIDNIHLIPPADYKDFISLMKNSYIVLTDSGGIQEELSIIGKPCLVMRDVTERQEAIDKGTVKLVGTDIDKIITNVEELLENEDTYNKMKKTHTAFGDGHASEKIIESLFTYLESK